MVHDISVGLLVINTVGVFIGCCFGGAIIKTISSKEDIGNKVAWCITTGLCMVVGYWLAVADFKGWW